MFLFNNGNVRTACLAMLFVLLPLDVLAASVSSFTAVVGGSLEIHKSCSSQTEKKGGSSSGVLSVYCSDTASYRVSRGNSDIIYHPVALKGNTEVYVLHMNKSIISRYERHVIYF